MGVDESGTEEGGVAGSTCGRMVEVEYNVVVWSIT